MDASALDALEADLRARGLIIGERIPKLRMEWRALAVVLAGRRGQCEQCGDWPSTHIGWKIDFGAAIKEAFPHRWCRRCDRDERIMARWDGAVSDWVVAIEWLEETLVRRVASDALPPWRRSLIPTPGETCDCCGEPATFVVEFSSRRAGQDVIACCHNAARSWSRAMTPPNNRDGEFRSVQPYLELVEGTWYISQGWPPDAIT